MAKLSTFRDVLGSRTNRVTAHEPLSTTEEYIKYAQPWPINEEKKEQDKPSVSKKQKTDAENHEGRKTALNRVSSGQTFDTETYLSVPLVRRKELNEDVRVYTFEHHLKSLESFHLGIGQHIQCAFMMMDGTIVERPYAIIRPTGADEDDGTIDILVKTSFPSEKSPGGTISNILDCLDDKRKDEMLIRGPEGPISYLGNGKFSIQSEGRGAVDVKVKRVNFISGGTGMTPIYATIRAIMETDSNDCNVEVKFMDANINEKEILMKEKLDELSSTHDRLEVIHVLEKPGGLWKGERGLIDKEKMEKHLFAPEEGTVSLVCGPPPMMKAAKEGLLELGFKDEETFFHY